MPRASRLSKPRVQPILASASPPEPSRQQVASLRDTLVSETMKGREAPISFTPAKAGAYFASNFPELFVTVCHVPLGHPETMKSSRLMLRAFASSRANNLLRRLQS